MLTEKQLQEQLQVIMDFLRLVHPSLERTEGYRPAVELRPVPRGLEKNGKETFPLTWSLNLWALDEKGQDRLRGFLARHNGQQTCLFYSIFTWKQPADSETRVSHISAKSAVFTEEIALDFDHVDEAGYQDLVRRFDAIGLDAIWVASGHGYQAHILLDKPVYDKDILATCVDMFRQQGFDCDAHCIDPARVMRLPGTYNNKCFADDTLAGERENPPLCQVVSWTSVRYSIDGVLSRLTGAGQQTVMAGFDVAPAQRKKPAKPAAKEQQAPAPAESFTGDNDTVIRRIDYPYISDFELPDAVVKMLTHTRQGYRNKVLGFLVNFLRQNYRLSHDQCHEILQLWSRMACEPPYTDIEYESDFRRFFYQYRGLPYDSSLAKQFGTIDFEGFITLRRKNYVYIPNRFFSNFADMDGHIIRVYLAIKMLEHNRLDATQEAIAETLGVTKRTVITCLPALIQQGHCYKTEGVRRLGIPNTYHTSHIASPKEGYMSLSYNDIHAFVTDLNGIGSTTKAGADLKLYLYFRWKFYSGEIYMSQNKLGQELGLTRSAIGKATKRLEEQHYLQIDKVGENPLYQHCVYTLLR